MCEILGLLVLAPLALWIGWQLMLAVRARANRAADKELQRRVDEGAKQLGQSQAEDENDAQLRAIIRKYENRPK